MEKPPERDLLNLYASSKIILSVAHFEPFGMSVAEGMMLRAVPAVYRGPLSGPWIDIIDKGNYGIGFRTTEELAEAIEHVINTEYFQEKIHGTNRGHNIACIETLPRK